MTLSCGRRLFVVMLLIMFRGSVEASEGCPDARLLSEKLLTDICWSCLFPVRIAGFPMGGGRVPDGAANKSLCLCQDNVGVSNPGLTTGMWVPARLIEVVRSAGCAPALSGVRLPVGGLKRQQGTHGSGDLDTGDVAFYHYHYYAFPLLSMLGLVMQGACFTNNYQDMDVMYLSELDPTWQNDELAFFTQPEAAFVANPLALAACSADVLAASGHEPIDSLFWCVGSWGHLYPMSGHTLASGSLAENTSHLAARAVAAQHRRLLARKTMGNGALCGGVLDPMFPKSQYKLTMFYPVPETQQGHVIGEPTFQWGEWRMIPGSGEDTLYILWRWQDCCHGAR